MYRLIPVILSCLLMAAHYLRKHGTYSMYIPTAYYGHLALWLSASLVLFIRRGWVANAFTFLLIAGAGLWVDTTVSIWKRRAMMGEAGTRMAIILGSVAVFTALSALVFRSKRLKTYFRAKDFRADDDTSSIPGTVAFLLTALILGFVQEKVRIDGRLPVILLERFIHSGGWFQTFWLAVYAGFLADKMQSPSFMKKWRPRVWALFSLVFFSQLIAGLSGYSRFLMTGKLHVPVPALIAAGPLYRGSEFFMLILFFSTVALVGPAWCSWLCYIGSWDDIAARRQKKPTALPRWRVYLRIALLVVVLAVAYLFRYFGVSGNIAAWFAAGFGVVGVVLMFTWSRATGVMTHCSAYCPIGVLSCNIGKLNPFRIKIGDRCNECGACGVICRYGALSSENIASHKPGESCTLCGDCVNACKDNCIDYRFPGLSSSASRKVFIVIVVALHAAFLGVARI